MTNAGSVAWAVRRDWPDGSHEFIGPEPTELQACQLLDGDFGKWRRSPVRPRLSVVAIGVGSFWSHARARQDCRSTACPSVSTGALA